MACTSPINYDSVSLVVIDKDRLGHYEDANKPMEVRQISSEPQAWSIQSPLNVGGDGYDTPISEIFVLGGRKLGIAGTDGVRVYQKRSEEHTSELQSLMRIPYSVFFLTKNKTTTHLFIT